MNIELLDRLKEIAEEKSKSFVPHNYWPLFTRKSTVQKDAYKWGIKTMIQEIEDLKALILVQEAMKENTNLSDEDKEKINSATTLNGIYFYLHDYMYKERFHYFHYFAWVSGANYFVDHDEDGYGPIYLNAFLKRYAKQIKFIK